MSDPKSFNKSLNGYVLSGIHTSFEYTQEKGCWVQVKCPCGHVEAMIIAGKEDDLGSDIIDLINLSRWEQAVRFHYAHCAEAQ